MMMMMMMIATTHWKLIQFNWRYDHDRIKVKFIQLTSQKELKIGKKIIVLTLWNEFCTFILVDVVIAL